MAAVEILGDGGHGNDIAGIVAALGGRSEFWDDALSENYSISAYVRQLTGYPYVIGINDPLTRRSVDQRIADRSVAATIVHPTATVALTAHLDGGCVVGAGTHIGPGVTAGPHVHFGPGCTVTRTTIGAYTTISPGVDIAGDVTIGECVLIGVGARVANLRSIGDRAVIGAGAVVVRDVAPDTTVVSRDLTATGSQP